MLHEFCHNFEKHYYPGIAKHVTKWVEGCEICAKDKRVPNNAISPELFNLPEWDLRPEDGMQILLLPNFPNDGGYQTVMTAIDIFQDTCSPTRYMTH